MGDHDGSLDEMIKRAISEIATSAALVLAGLEARVAALEASRPLSGCRETAWAVRLEDGLFVGESLGTMLNASMPRNVLFFPSRSDAQTLRRVLGYGEPKLVYKDTLEEVTS